MDSEQIFDEHLEQTVYRDKQVTSMGVHITLKTVANLDSPAEIDFGGGEYESADRVTIEPEKRAADDDYGWWELDAGNYSIQFNETVSSQNPVFLVVPNERLIGCGCDLAPVYVDTGPIQTMLHVPERGVNIKENARIALLREV